MTVKVWSMDITVESKTLGVYSYHDWVIGETEEKAIEMVPRYCENLRLKLIDFKSHGVSDWLYLCDPEEDYDMLCDNEEEE